MQWPLLDVPEQFRDAVRKERAALSERAGQARQLASAGDRDGLRALAADVQRQVTDGDRRAGGHLHKHWADIHSAFDAVFDEVFPVADPADPADVLDGPWPSRSRVSMLVSLNKPPSDYRDPIARLAVAASDIRLMRIVMLSPVGYLRRDTVIAVLDALAGAESLDAEVAEHALLRDVHLGAWLLGRPTPGMPMVQRAPAACAAAVQPYFDELVWRLTANPEASWDALPKGLTPRGLRFVLRALTWTGAEEIAAFLGAADLTAAEYDALVEYLRTRPTAEQQRAFILRRRAEGSEAILPLLGLADAAALLRVMQGISTTEVIRLDRAAIVDAAAQAGPDACRRLLELCPSEPVGAALGLNRTAVENRVKHNALVGIASFGLLPLADGETVLDRYLALREIARRGAKLGPNRRISSAAAVEVALDHLAQVAGAPDASRMEWDCEARIAADSPGEWTIEGYNVAVRPDGTDAAISVSREGKPLKSVPARVRAHPSYALCREQQQRLRAQASRMRTGLIERLVGTGATVDPGELARLLTLPSGSAMLPALIWRDHAGAIGLLGEVDQGGPVTAMHPFHLFEQGLLAHWQGEVVRRRLTQPVKQAFRELYLVTPAERDAVDTSARFAGHVVAGKIAAQLLSTRGWSLLGEYDDYQARRPVADDLTAALCCDVTGYFGMGDVTVREVRFLSARSATAEVVPLAAVPPIAFSEVMRDLDLVVSVASTGSYHGSSAQSESRAQLLTALIGDLGLDRVTVEGTSAVIRGSRATYRVHLSSGSIHVEPGGYLCIVPATFGATAHRRLFLPFADEDRMTSIILSKILLLAEDEKITDRTILTQLDALLAR